MTKASSADTMYDIREFLEVLDENFRPWNKFTANPYNQATAEAMNKMDIEFLRHIFKHLEEKEIDKPKERWLVLENKILRPVDTHQYFRQTD